MDAFDSPPVMSLKLVKARVEGVSHKVPETTPAQNAGAGVLDMDPQETVGRARIVAGASANTHDQPEWFR